jgi:hypothetical protein
MNTTKTDALKVARARRWRVFANGPVRSLTERLTPIAVQRAIDRRVRLACPEIE